VSEESLNQNAPSASSELKSASAGMVATSGEEKQMQRSTVIYVANVHLEGHPTMVAKRVQQVDSLVTSLQRQQQSRARAAGVEWHPDDEHVIVCGDFNCEERGAALQLLVQGRLAAGMFLHAYM